MGPLLNFYNYPEINKFILDINSGIRRYNKCLALIGNKSKTKIVLNKIIKQIGNNNCYLFDNNVISRIKNTWDENGEYIIPGPFVNERNIFNKKLVVFKPDNITPLTEMTGEILCYIGGDKINVYLKNNDYRPNSEIVSEENEYEIIHGVFKSNFVIELTPEDYNDACNGFKRKLQAVYL